MQKLHLDKIRRAEIADADGQIYKMFGKIVSKREYNYTASKLIEIISTKGEPNAASVVHNFMQKLADYDLEPFANISITPSISMNFNEIRYIMACAEDASC